MRKLLLIGLGLLAALPAGCGPRRPAVDERLVEHSVRALRDPDARVRKKAASKLGNIGPEEPAVLPALVGALKDRDAGVRAEAVLALAKCGPAAREAVPALEAARKDANPRVREYATRALEKVRAGGDAG